MVYLQGQAPGDAPAGRDVLNGGAVVGLWGGVGMWLGGIALIQFVALIVDDDMTGQAAIMLSELHTELSPRRIDLS